MLYDTGLNAVCMDMLYDTDLNAVCTDLIRDRLLMPENPPVIWYEPEDPSMWKKSTTSMVCKE